MESRKGGPRGRAVFPASCASACTSRSALFSATAPGREHRQSIQRRTRSDPRRDKTGKSRGGRRKWRKKSNFVRSRWISIWQALSCSQSRTTPAVICRLRLLVSVNPQCDTCPKPCRVVVGVFWAGARREMHSPRQGEGGRPSTTAARPRRRTSDFHQFDGVGGRRLPRF